MRLTKRAGRHDKQAKGFYHITDSSILCLLTSLTAHLILPMTLRLQGWRLKEAVLQCPRREAGKWASSGPMHAASACLGPSREDSTDWAPRTPQRWLMRPRRVGAAASNNVGLDWLVVLNGACREP